MVGELACQLINGSLVRSQVHRSIIQAFHLFSPVYTKAGLDSMEYANQEILVGDCYIMTLGVGGFSLSVQPHRGFEPTPCSKKGGLVNPLTAITKHVKT